VKRGLPPAPHFHLRNYLRPYSNLLISCCQALLPFERKWNWAIASCYGNHNQNRDTVAEALLASR